MGAFVYIENEMGSENEKSFGPGFVQQKQIYQFIMQFAQNTPSPFGENNQNKKTGVFFEKRC